MSAELSSSSVSVPSTSGDHLPTARSPNYSDSEIACLRQDIMGMAAVLHGKLDKVINNQQDLFTRMEKNGIQS